MGRVMVGLLVALIFIVGGARLMFNLNTRTGNEGLPVKQPWSYGKMEFVAWNDEKWTAWIHEDAFVQLPRNANKWSRHSNQSLAFIGWEGEPWQAKVDGDGFVLAQRGDWNGTTERTAALRYRDWRGENQLRTVPQLRR